MIAYDKADSTIVAIPPPKQFHRPPVITFAMQRKLVTIHHLWRPRAKWLRYKPGNLQCQYQ
jgi:hypothetical protein